MKLQKQQEKIDAANPNKTDIGWGQHIRSYLLQPVKDLRTSHITTSPGDVLDGDVEDFVQASLAHKVKGGGGQVIEDDEIDKACGAIDGDKGIGPAPVECGQIFDVDVNRADWLFGCEGQRLFPLAARRLRHAVALQAAMHRRARDIRPDAAAHDVRDIVDGQCQCSSKLSGDFFLKRVKARLNMLGPKRAVGDRGPGGRASEREFFGKTSRNSQPAPA